MLVSTLHSAERLEERFAITHTELDELYSNGLYIPIGNDSNALHLLFWSVIDKQSVVALIGKHNNIITLMSVVYHQNQNRFVIDFGSINRVKKMTLDYYANRLAASGSKLIRYKYVFTDLNGKTKISKDETFYDGNDACFETEKLKILLPNIRSFISVTPRNSCMSKELLDSKVRNAIKNLMGVHNV